MLATTHILAALLLSKYVGHSIPILIGAVLIDLDHLYHIFKHAKRKGGLINAGLELFQPHPEVDESRTLLHSIPAWLVISIIAYLINPTFGSYLSLGYALHLLMDAFDSSKLHLFYPHKYNVTGPVEFGSLVEYLLGIVMFIMYFWF